MSPQADYVVSNGTGAAVRSDINGQLAAIVSNNSGASAPATTYAYMLWADTSTNLLKLRNGANSAWITVGDLTAANLGLAALASPTFTGTVTIPTATISTGVGIPLGSAASPTIYFTGDTNTGIYSPGADQFAITTGGSGRVFVDSSGRVGLGTSTPGTKLDVVGGAIRTDDIFTLYKNATDAFYIGAGSIITGGASTDIALRSNQNGSILFSTNGSTERMRLDASGRLGIGTTSPSAPLHVKSTNPQVIVDSSDSSTESRIRWYKNGSSVGAIYSDSGNLRILSESAIAFTIAGGSPSSESARIDSSGRLLVGTSSARTNFFNAASSYTPQLQLEGTGATGQTMLSITSGDTSLPGYLILARQKSGSIGGNTAVANNDVLGNITFQGSDGSEFVPGAYIAAEVDGTPGANDLPTRLVFSTTADGASSPTERFRINSNGTAKFETLNLLFGGTTPAVYRSGADGSGIHFTTNAVVPTNETGAISDNTESFGNAGYRWSVIYAGTGTINTSDINEKQDIQDLSAAELTVAQELKTLFKTFRWKDAVAQKGDNARIHVGVIAQDVEQLFTKHGLDASKYALWCSDTWYEVDGKGIAEDGSVYTAETEGAVKKTRLGVRYDQLLAFVLAAL